MNDSPIDQVTSFKYLGVLISSNLSWSLHILSICRKSRKLIGILYRLFYRHTSPPALFKPYSTLIRPHLEYCSSIWDPSSSATISHLEKVQFFALKLCAKSWSSNYLSLLQLFNCPSLSSRRKKSKLISLFKILNGYMFPPPIPSALHTFLLCLLAPTILTIFSSLVPALLPFFPPSSLIPVPSGTLYLPPLSLPIFRFF